VLQRDYPQIDLEIVTGSSAALFRDLARQHIDIMIGRPDDDIYLPNYDYHLIGREPMVLCARPGHPLAKGGPHRLRDMIDLPWILQRRGGRSRLKLEQLFREAGLPLPRQIVGSDSLVITLSYISRSQALTILSEPVARQQAAFGQIALIANTLDLSLSPYGLIVSRERPLSSVVATVLGVLRTTLRPGAESDWGESGTSG